MITSSGLNVLSNTFRDKMAEQDVIDGVANMINTSGANRAQRRRLEKGLAKVNKLSEKAQKKLDHSAYEHYKQITDEDFTHFNAVLALVMVEDYGWKEDERHNQITSLLDRFQNKMRKCQNAGMDTDDVVDEVFKLTGIQLISDIKAAKEKTDS